MTETLEKSSLEPLLRPQSHEGGESVESEDGDLALPSLIDGSGTLDRLVETAHD